MIRLTSYLYALLDFLLPDTRKFSYVRARLVQLLLGASIGRGTRIYKNVYFGVNGTNFSCGSNCRVNRGARFETENGRSSIRLGNNVAVGHDTMMTVGSHDIGPSSERAGQGNVSPVTVGDGCWFGARATVLQGVTIGGGAVVGAMALVNRDVDPDTMVAGVPARFVKHLSTEIELRERGVG